METPVVYAIAMHLRLNVSYLNGVTAEAALNQLQNVYWADKKTSFYWIVIQILAIGI